MPHGARVRWPAWSSRASARGPPTASSSCCSRTSAATVNLIVPPPVYERHRLSVRTEPLLLAEGRLERLPMGGGAVNVMVDRLQALHAPDAPLAQIRDFTPEDERERRRRAAAAAGEDEHAAAAGAAAGAGAGDFRAVAPPVLSFAQGRRR